MTSSELKERIKSACLYPIPVEAHNERGQIPELIFSGSVDQFLEAAKALGASVIFLFTSQLDEEDFYYESDLGDDYEFEDDADDDEHEDSDEPTANPESFDLTAALPSLAEFKKHIGQESWIQLTAKNRLVSINIQIFADWWDEFNEQRVKAKEKCEENLEVHRERMEEKQEKKEKELLAKMRGLLDDQGFCRIPTQREMKVYALEKFPELEDVDESRLVQEIQKLSDKAKARRRK
jgi:hypothetical protein